MNILSLLTHDADVIRDIRTLIDLLKKWELEVYDNVELAWIAFLQREPELTVIDLDMMGARVGSQARRKKVLERSPLILFISSRV
jgi:hypothetical protein